MDVRRWRGFVRHGLLAALWLVAAASGGAVDMPIESASVGVLRGEGRWEGAGDSDAGRAEQRWDMTAVKIDEHELRGRVSVSGSPILTTANVEGRFSGRGVVGKLLDDEGAVLVEFQGTVTRLGISGTYRDRDGGSGSWSWEGYPAK